MMGLILPLLGGMYGLREDIMTEQNPATFLQGGTHPAEGLRRMLLTMTDGAEGYYATGDLLVSEKAGGADMSVDVAAGRAWVLGTEDTFQGVYHIENRLLTNVVVSAADSSDPRIDLLVAKIEDANYSGSLSLWSLAVVTGTPAGSPSAPTQPANSLLLGTIAVAASAASIVDANITDNRTQYNPHYVFTSQSTGGAGTAFEKADYPWAKYVRVRMVGGGGGSSGIGTTAAGQWNCSGGASGGAYAESVILVEDLASSIAIVIGTGGSGGVGASAGGGGTSSTFGSTVVVADGGTSGGFSAAAAFASGALSGDSTSTNTGDITAPSDGGGSGLALGLSSANQQFGGAGGGSYFAGRTDMPRAGEGVRNGNAPGGGGSGTAQGASGSDLTGGDGADGIVIIEIFG
jgi:hypothetical protein